MALADLKEIGAHSTRNDGGLDPSVSAAIQSAVSESMGSLADNLTQVIESRLSDFAKRFSEENSSSVEQAVKRARREHYTCKRKGNQQQLDHSLQVLDKLDEASDALKQKSYEKVKVALESGTELVSKRVKAIKLADKTNLVGRLLTNICLTSSPLTPTTRREFTGPRGEPRGKSIKRSVVVSVSTIKEPVPPLHSARLLRQDPRLLIWLLVRKLDQLVVWDLVLR